MNCGFSELFCCIRPSPSINFIVSRIEFTNSHAYADVFIQVDRTYILDSDFLYLTKPGELSSSQKILIIKEPGNLSGVSRVTFPFNGETFIISYIRHIGHQLNILGEFTINIPYEQKDSMSTDNTEDYSPMFRPSLNKKHMLV